MDSEQTLSTAAIAVARHVAAEVITYTRDHPVTGRDTKRDAADIVTDVDRAVEQLVRERVTTAFPDHGFVGEEFGGTPTEGPCWYLDPVDGTTNLANEVPWTSMSLCLAVGDQPLVGVVADPWRGEVLSAQHGQGAWSGDVRLGLGGDASLAGSVVGTELNGQRPWTGFGAFLDALAERYATLRVMGSGTLTLAQVAAGRGVGAYVDAFHPIDHGAAVLLVHEAGGVVVGADGPVDGFPPADGRVLVAHPAVAAELEAILSGARQSST